MSPDRSDERRGLVAIFTGMLPASLLVQALSFASSVVLATRLGPKTTTDAYYLALSVPLVAYAVLIAAVRLGGIPALTAVSQAESREDFSHACSALMTATIGVASFLGIAVTGVMLVVLPAVAGGSSHLSALTRLYMLELSPYVVTGTLLGALGAILAVRGRFVMTVVVLAFEPAAKSVLLLWFHRQLGAQALIIGGVAGNFAAVLVLWALVHHHGIVLRLVDFRSSPVVRKVFKLSLPLVISQSILQMNPLIDRTAAASLGGGSVTMFEMGVRLFTAPTVLLTGVIVAPLAAQWSARLTAEGWEAVARSFGRLVTAIVIVVPPVVLLGFLLRRDLVYIAYHSHLYTTTAISTTADVLGMLLLGLIPQILIVPLTILFLIHGDTVFPLKVGIANFLLNAILDVLFRGPFGVPGIACSTALTLMILCIVCVTQARRRWGSLHLRVALRPLTVSMGSCAAISAACIFVLRLQAPNASRATDLMMAGLVLAVAVLIHGSVLIIGRSSVAAALPVAAKWLRAPATERQSDQHTTT